MDRFTSKSAEAVQGAMQLADQLSHQAVEPLHLLMALIGQSGGLVPSILEKLEINLKQIQEKIKKELITGPRVKGGAQGYITGETKAVLDQAETEASKLKDKYISTEHLFLAILEQPTIKNLLDVSQKDVMEELKKIRGHQRVTDQDPEGKYQVLEKYTQDFTALAEEGKIDPVILQ